MSNSFSPGPIYSVDKRRASEAGQVSDGPIPVPPANYKPVSPTTNTSGFANAASTGVASSSPSTTSTSGFAAGISPEHASGGIPATTKLLSGLNLLSSPNTMSPGFSPGSTTGGLASSPNVAALSTSGGVVHAEGMSRAELLGKKAEVVSGVKLEEMSPAAQAEAQITGLHKPTLLEDARGLLGQAGAAVFAHSPAVVKQQLEEYNLAPKAGGVSPAASPIKGPITSAGLNVGRRASLALEQAKHLLAGDATTTTGTTTTTVPGTAAEPGLAPRAVPQSSLADKATRRASAVYSEFKKEFDSIKNDLTAPGGLAAASNGERRASVPKLDAKAAPGTVASETTVLEQAKGLFGGLVDTIKTELTTGGAAVKTINGQPAAISGETAVTLPAGEPVVPPVSASDNIASSSGTSGIYAAPEPETVKSAEPVTAAVPKAVESSEPAVPVATSTSTSTGSAPALAPALGAFIESTPATAALSTHAIEAEPKQIVPVNVDPSEKTVETGVPALPISALSGVTGLSAPASVRTDSLTSVTAIKNGEAGDLHNHKGAAIGLDPVEKPVATHSPLADSAPGHKDNGVGSSAVSSTPSTDATTNGSVDKTTANSEPHKDVSDTYAAVGHGTPASPASSAPAISAAKSEQVGSAVEGHHGHARTSSASSNGKKSGFLSKIKAKLHHDKD